MKAFEQLKFDRCADKIYASKVAGSLAVVEHRLAGYAYLY